MNLLKRKLNRDAILEDYHKLKIMDELETLKDRDVLFECPVDGYVSEKVHLRIFPSWKSPLHLSSGRSKTLEALTDIEILGKNTDQWSLVRVGKNIDEYELGYICTDYIKTK